MDKIDLLCLKKSEHSELLSKMAVLEGEMKKFQSLKYDVSYSKLERIRELEVHTKREPCTVHIEVQSMTCSYTCSKKLKPLRFLSKNWKRKG